MDSNEGPNNSNITLNISPKTPLKHLKTCIGNNHEKARQGTFGGRRSLPEPKAMQVRRQVLRPKPISRFESQALSAVEHHLRRPKVCFRFETQLSGARLGGQSMHPKAGSAAETTFGAEPEFFLEGHNSASHALKPPKPSKHPKTSTELYYNMHKPLTMHKGA